MKFFIVIIFGLCVGQNLMAMPAATLDYCEFQLAQGVALGFSTEIFLNLIRALFQNKNALSSNDLKTLVSHGEIANPFDVLSFDLSSEDIYAFKNAFNKILNSGKALDWARIRDEYNNLIDGKEVSEGERESSKEATAKILFPFVRREMISQDLRLAKTVLGSFILPDGTPFVLTEEGSEIGVYDLKSKARTALKDRVYKAFGGAKFHQTKSGKTYIAMISSNLYSVFEVTPKHEIKLIRGDLKTDDPEYLNLKFEAITENKFGHPSIVESLWYNGRQEFYNEIDVETGATHYIETPALQGHAFHTVVSGDGHVISSEKRGDKLLFKDLSLGIDIKDLKLPTFPVDLSNLLAPTSQDLFLPYFSPTYHTAWLDVKNARQTDFGNKVNAPDSPILLIPYNDTFLIESENLGIRSVVIPHGDSAHVVNLPIALRGGTTPKILKLRSGDSILFIGSRDGVENERSNLIWLNLNTNEVKVLNLNGMKISKFIDVRETNEGAIEALYQSYKGFKFIQLYGPLAKEGAL